MIDSSVKSLIKLVDVSSNKLLVMLNLSSCGRTVKTMKTLIHFKFINDVGKTDFDIDFQI